MQKHKANPFAEKFSLLNSQKHTEDIKWSSSSSSDYENTSCNDDKICNIQRTRNRKRKSKPKVPKNISNLDITFIDASKDHKNNLYREKSPILESKCLECPASPILTTSKLPNTAKSPILSSNKRLHPKSPILILKSESPKYSVKVRKKLSYYDQQKGCSQNSFNQNTERIIYSDLRQTETSKNYESLVEKNASNLYLKTEIVSSDGSLEILSGNVNTEEDALKEKLNLVNKVKNYFDSHFSSESTSQNISDTPTPEDIVKHEEIQILSCKSQTSFIQQPKHDSKSNSDSSNYFEKNTKKVKYKKGGLANRLNTLLKKQNAHVSLWHHERFLAENSNFVIPKGEHVVFYIRKLDFKYGCFLLDVIDVKNDKYFMFINSLYVNNNIIITADSVLKLYEPFTILDTNTDYKIIVNVSKFECIDLKKP